MNRKRRTYLGFLRWKQLRTACTPMTKFITSMRLLGLLACVLVTILLTNCYTTANIKASSQELLFNFTPLRDPVATYVRVSHQGHAQALHYIGSRLLVVEAFEGNLPTEITSRLFVTVNSSAFKRGELSQILPGNVAIEGDLFSILAIAEGRLTGRIGGFVHLAPNVVSSQIEQLLAVVKHLKPIPLAAAYLESNPILLKKRFAVLQSEGKLKNFSTLPEGLQQILQLAINRPNTFVALNKPQYQQFLSYKTGSELLLDKQGNGYEIKLYTTNANQ